MRAGFSTSQRAEGRRQKSWRRPRVFGHDLCLLPSAFYLDSAGCSTSSGLLGGGGKAIVYDLGHEKHDVFGSAAPITRLAFAPVGKMLVVATPGSVFLGKKKVATGEVEAIGWFDGRPAAALERGLTPPLVRTFGSNGRPLEAFSVPGRVVGLTGGLVVTRTQAKVLAGWRTTSVSTLLDVRPATSVDDVAIG